MKLASFMRCYMLKDFRTAFLCSLALFGLLLLPATSFAQSGIQMLPPIQPNKTDCPQQAGVPQVLAWDGVNPLYCIPKFTVDPNTGILASGDPANGGGGLLVGTNQFFGSVDSTTFGLVDGVGSLTLKDGNVTATGNVVGANLKLKDAQGVVSGPLTKSDLDALLGLAKLNCADDEVIKKTAAGFACATGGGKTSQDAVCAPQPGAPPIFYCNVGTLKDGSLLHGFINGALGWQWECQAPVSSGRNAACFSF